MLEEFMKGPNADDVDLSELDNLGFVDVSTSIHEAQRKKIGNALTIQDTLKEKDFNDFYEKTFQMVQSHYGDSDIMGLKSDISLLSRIYNHLGRKVDALKESAGDNFGLIEFSKDHKYMNLEQKQRDYHNLLKQAIGNLEDIKVTPESVPIQVDLFVRQTLQYISKLEEKDRKYSRTREDTTILLNEAFGRLSRVEEVLSESVKNHYLETAGRMINRWDPNDQNISRRDSFAGFMLSVVYNDKGNLLPISKDQTDSSNFKPSRLKDPMQKFWGNVNPYKGSN